MVSCDTTDMFITNEASIKTSLFLFLILYCVKYFADQSSKVSLHAHFKTLCAIYHIPQLREIVPTRIETYISMT